MENEMRAQVADDISFKYGHNATPGLTEMDQRFAEFHLANPSVYKELVRLARQAKSQGAGRVGIRMLWEVMRWNLTIVVKPDAGFVLNDHYTSRFARLMMTQEPDLKGFFNVRELRS